ncbi:D-inositol-3-phosphate glycosyltransferase [Kineococcus radiotolerans]|uniref:D-inositol 3-phosphate glycosyltransferase n=2 Tax=Kineococcus radiotolerans TaxID=131568 RepID=MSHA_KINRD|nr:D-inositol-3-phosphate glycosyltransferase [Kineococcus radiotolerans]A6W6D9.1 RecName: Full=D-inositol 3-phosphate glycosyltransferase; AltName: Full=N-acetylglucosamine-inositol-phosphate N-acetylglucosaminyltransferase; Short=GlcNAc-Ins-P N-acetylglucosaminyltransferase [Kineococcus radiotolerans SRS30216 = ATCC BAA-149]ABS02378.1 glycosyl transferase group 1 [Kineococcus radiotolerans SRS30216 = ATCC BAA-149]MBB2900430.1 D-inositol-3-phosphate glycosyltransferase [Kineococcus radiotoleran
MRRSSSVQRVALLSVHTSPLAQPGTGDAGGMNVYVVELATQLARRGVEVEVFTRRTSSEQPPVVETADGVRVRHVAAGPYEGLAKDDLPGQLCAFTAGMLHAEARHAERHYDLVHSHYWLSGQVGWLTADRWDVPLVHSMHTMAKVKNAALAEGDAPEPAGRVIGEQQVVEAADRLVANTDAERRELIDLYGADPAKVVVVPPGVDLATFAPAPGRAASRARLGVPADAEVLLFVGRIQPLKAPDLLVRATAELLREQPWRRSRLRVVVLGGPSGSGTAHPDSLADLVRSLDLEDVVRMAPPVARAELADHYRAADVVAVPSHNESFGLVALEAQACATPVVAAAVGGLRTAVLDDGAGAGTGEGTGLLVPDHTPRSWAAALRTLLDDPARRTAMGARAARRAQGFGWGATAEATLEVYRRAVQDRAAERGADPR